MGAQQSSYPCQVCGTIFQREISGTLLCESCQIFNKFKFNLTSFDREIYILSNTMNPKYDIVKNKKPMLSVIHSLKTGFCSKEFWQQIKKNCMETKRMKLIKQLLIHIDKMDLFKKYKGIYIHTLLSNDILFIHHQNIQDEDRIIHLNLDQLEKKILEKSYMV